VTEIGARAPAPWTIRRSDRRLRRYRVRGEAAVALGVGAAYQTQLGGENAQAGMLLAGRERPCGAAADVTLGGRAHRVLHGRGCSYELARHPPSSSPFQALVPELRADICGSPPIPQTPEARTCRASAEVELGELEPPTSWVRCGRCARGLLVRKCGFAGSLSPGYECLGGADTGGYAAIPVGFRHSWR
jgi:hypothetical protein